MLSVVVSIAKKLNRPATRADLESLPANVKGEIIDGELFVQPRPRPRHARAAGKVYSEVQRLSGSDGDDPPGWWLLIEPGIELEDAPEIAPDVAGWRRSRLPEIPGDDPITIAPDWVLEVLSPSNRAYDRGVKFPYYARIGVGHLWVVDPPARTIEVKRLVKEHWLDLKTFVEDEVMRAEPFSDIPISLSKLWLP